MMAKKKKRIQQKQKKQTPVKTDLGLKLEEALKKKELELSAPPPPPSPKAPEKPKKKEIVTVKEDPTESGPAPAVWPKKHRTIRVLRAKEKPNYYRTFTQNSNNLVHTPSRQQKEASSTGGGKIASPEPATSQEWEKLVQPEEAAINMDKDSPPSSDQPSSTSALKRQHFYWQRVGDHQREERDLVIGFDFGTSCTKIIIQDQQRKNAVAVPFDSLGHLGSKFLLPTTIYLSKSGDFSLSPIGKRYGGIKLALLERSEKPIAKDRRSGKSVIAMEMAVAYIALTLCEVRNWFWSNKSKEFQHIRINWELNIGLPSRSFENKELLELMKLVAMAGWNAASGSSDRISVIKIKESVSQAKNQIELNTFDANTDQLHPDFVSPIPEIIAEVVGYAKSTLRETGMHLLVDVGASTVDVSTFILHEKEGDDQYEILTAEVEKYGVYMLHKHRVHACKHLYEELLKKAIKKADGITPLPDIEEYFPSDIEKGRLLNENTGFLSKASILLRKVVKITWEKRNPNAPEWKTGLPVFICGGGGLDPNYSDMVIEAGKALKNTEISEFQRRKLPKPPNLENTDISPNEFHRLSVAYGLSFSKDDIGKIIPAHAIKDSCYVKKEKDIEKAFVDKDMV